MFKSLYIALFTATLFLTGSLAQPNFVMNCTIYPDICDNTCNAVFCHSITTRLHYDSLSNSDRPNPNATTTAATYRRNNVGCGANNYCAGTGTDCDEYPYASTFDGGLGCIAQRFNGTVAQSGTTRCANSSQNRSHGARIAAFYRQNNLTDGSAFNIVFDTTIDNAPLCRAVRNGNLTGCPTNNGPVYRFRDAPPAGSFCPSRTNFTAAAVEVTDDAPSAEAFDTGTIIDDKGREFIYTGGRRPARGSKIWMATEDGDGEESTVVA